MAEIIVNKTGFHLTNGKISYQMLVDRERYLLHNYWGKAIKTETILNDTPLLTQNFSPYPSKEAGYEYSLNLLPQEFPTNGDGDYRETALNHKYFDQTYISQLKYSDFEIIEGKVHLENLPQTYLNHQNEAKTLKIILKDDVYSLTYHLFYTVFSDLNIITRSVQVVNKSDKEVEIEKILSASLDFDHSNFELIQLPGSWAREREIVRQPIYRGVHKLDSKRGTTGHSYQPFFALVDPSTTEETGEVFGFHLIYSGEFVGNVEVDEFNKTRAQLGINPEHFNWHLESGERFQTPEAVLVYSDKGGNGMSHQLHDLYQNHLIRGKHKYQERPVLMNNWEGTYFDFTEDKLLEMADESKKLGIELFVLDDGWFGNRDNDTVSLGDWYEHEKKLPTTLKKLAETIKSKGLKFGIWFEPEMISEDSDLFKKHPDWLLKSKRREASLGRNQYVIDLSRKEVRDNILLQLKKILDEVPIDYVKWDYNRNMTEIGSMSSEMRDGEVAHRFILGLYDMLEDLTTSYPDILWESCSGGGGRFDPGMLYYMPQSWTSDNTDAVERLKIQTGTSLLFPISSMGAHVSASPNHQVNRKTTLKMRADVAMSGNLGYELDPTTLTDDEKNIIKEQINFYKENRKLIQYGRFTRIINPFESLNETAWIFVNEEKTEALYYYYKILNQANSFNPRVKLKGLDANKKYQVNESEHIYYGDELMNRGIYLQNEAFYPEVNKYNILNSDFQSVRLKITGK